MKLDRRKFLKLGAVASGTAVCAVAAPAAAREAKEADPNGFGMLNDSARCIGCRACQVACKKENKLPAESTLPPDRQAGQTLYDSPRELSEHTYTLIKVARDEKSGESTFVKRQCMHCVDPACQSACIVGALKKRADGSVEYDADMCMGCRYCMVACPFSVPQFEWHKALPSINKCTLCRESRLAKGEPTACSLACPAGAIVFARRGELLQVARRRIEAQPDLYLDHIYGESEVGGTNVLYLTRRNMAFAAMGLPDFGFKAVSTVTESIQHRIFQYFIPPIAVYSVLGGIMVYNQRRKDRAGKGGEDEY